MICTCIARSPRVARSDSSTRSRALRARSATSRACSGATRRRCSLPSLRIASSPPADERRRALRDALGALVPGWRPLAENVLGADARIDWVGRDGDGRCVIAMVARAGDDLALVAEGLAQRSWVAGRVADCARAAPHAGVAPE